MANTQVNVDPEEIAKFEDLASSWWDLEGQSKPLHQINPLRMRFITDNTTLQDRQIIDVGCGGGILSESLAKSGAHVTGIDMGKMPLDVAKLHALESEISIDYQQITAEEKAQQSAEQFDVVTCMEMLEHVPDPLSIIKACAQMLKPGGDIFLSTLNRHPKAYVFAILGAEYMLKMLPKGTHDYERFIRPAEMAQWCRQAGLEVVNIIGLSYNPLTKVYALGDDVKVNYLVHCRKAAS
ncbi:MAG: bifunctional 3-demethylubiquinol 3-O-methyltransferase/2-polyprenyl-6-hydroxyphenol methylase [Gammaproteobacteria bacterium]|nr:MAG: bifunctional 3-demethylubiquinol 3-O-methyltransferase/2-polyprenyl-6-hydroxyphenol methylase [Gammaproteobacteria bacterium]